MKDLVSIIIPVYNVERFLERCICSVLQQSYKRLEIILVDDGSTDDSGNICEKYANRDSRIHVLHKENGGLSSARNAGMDMMSGVFFTFIDSDDWVEDNYIKELVRNIHDEENIDIVQCGYCERNDNKECIYDAHIFEELLATKKEIMDAFFKSQNLKTMAWMKLYRAELFQSIRFVNGKNNEDTIFFADYIDKIKYIKIIDKKMYNYYVNSNSIMHAALNKKKVDDAYYSAEYMLNKCYTSFPEYSIYMMRNICSISMGLYMQLENPEKDTQLRKCILEKFNKYYRKIKGKRNIFSHRIYWKFKIFNSSKWLYRILWSIKQ